MKNGSLEQFLDTGWYTEAELYYHGYVYWCEGCTDEVDGIGHPERCEAEHHIAERAAADGSGQTYDIASKPVELFGGGKAGA